MPKLLRQEQTERARILRFLCSLLFKKLLASSETVVNKKKFEQEETERTEILGESPESGESRESRDESPEPDESPESRDQSPELEECPESDERQESRDERREPEECPEARARMLGEWYAFGLH